MVSPLRSGASAPSPYRNASVSQEERDAESGGNVDRLQRYGASYIPFIGGAWGVKYGIQELKSGLPLEKPNGIIDVGLGSANFVGGVSSIPGYGNMVLHALGPVAAIAGPIAAGAGVLAAAIDGGRDIYNAHKTGNSQDRTVGIVKIASGAVSAFGAATLNPIIMAAGTAVYMGAAAYQNREAIGKVAHSVGAKLAHALS